MNNFTPINPDLIPKTNNKITAPFKPNHGEKEPTSIGLQREAVTYDERKSTAEHVQTKEQEKNIESTTSEKQQKEKNEEPKIGGLKQVNSTSGQFKNTANNIKLPINDNKIIEEKNAPVTSSLRWLSELAIYILRKAHIKLKVIHGKVVRVITTK